MDKLPRNYVLKRGGVSVKFLLIRPFLGAIPPPITHFNTGISHYYIYARRDGILTLLGVGRGTSGRSEGGHVGYISSIFA